jgi:hypothetical protein
VNTAPPPLSPPSATARARRLVGLAGALVVAGCVSTSDVIEVGPDTYTTSATADGFRSAASARQSALEAGTAKCTALGRRLVLTGESSAPTRMGIDTTVTVTFRCAT